MPSVSQYSKDVFVGRADLRVVVAHSRPAFAEVPCQPTVSRHVATLSTVDGRFISGASAEIEQSPTHWSATIRQLDLPGAAASMYFVEGVREVIVRLDDGRLARARIVGATFEAGRERVYRLTGVERLSAAPANPVRLPITSA